MVAIDVGIGIWVVIVLLVVVGWMRDQRDSRKARELFAMRLAAECSSPTEEFRPHEPKHFTDSNKYDLSKHHRFSDTTAK